MKLPLHSEAFAHPGATRVCTIRPDGAEIVGFVHSAQPNSSPDAPTFLVLDGIGCTGWAFRHITPVLQTAHRVVFMDYRGHGGSPNPPRPWRLGMHVLADDAEALLAHLGIEQVVVVGFSMGMQVALELYRRHTHLVLGLVGIAGTSGQCLANVQGNSLFSRVFPLINAASRFVPEIIMGLWRKLVPSPLLLKIGLKTQVNGERIDLEAFQFYMTQAANMDPELFIAMLHEAHRHVGADILPYVDVPALLIAGARDKFVPFEVTRDIAFTIPKAQWSLFPEGSHGLPAEYPQEIGEQLLQFAQGLV